jgi:hypothetical protein
LKLKNRHDEAKRVLELLHPGDQEAVDKEIEDIELALRLAAKQVGLCRGLHPRYIGENIDLYLHPWDIANLPAQARVCSFCCFIKDVLDYHCQEGGHPSPDTLPIKGAPVEAHRRSNACVEDESEDNENEHLRIALHSGPTDESYDRELSDDTWSSHSEGEIRGSMGLFLNRPYQLTIELRPDYRRGRWRDIEIYQQSNKSNSYRICSN